jgi:hypothetical protein
MSGAEVTPAPGGEGVGKPAFGAPCNGCGLCCIMEQCALSVEYLGKQDRCPAIERMGDRFACGLVTRPGHYMGTPAFGDAYLGRLIGEALGIGRGCDSDGIMEVA